MIVLPRLFALLLLGRGSADDLHDLSHPSWDRLEATWDRLAVDARRAFPRALQTVGSSYSYSYSYMLRQLWRVLVPGALPRPER